MSSFQRDKRDYRLAISQKDQLKLREAYGFARYGIKIAQHQRATDFFLLRADGTGFRFSVVMADLAERLEVGVLSVEAAGSEYFPKSSLELPSEFLNELKAECLVLRTEFGDVDSGLALVSPSGGEIVIVSGAYPYTVEVRMTQTISPTGRFEPEYDIHKYVRRELS